MYQRLVIFCQSGEISPNLVMLEQENFVALMLSLARIVSNGHRCDQIW